jgi:hypothetical protein
LQELDTEGVPPTSHAVPVQAQAARRRFAPQPSARGRSRQWSAGGRGGGRLYRPAGDRRMSELTNLSAANPCRQNCRPRRFRPRSH